MDDAAAQRGASILSSGLLVITVIHLLTHVFQRIHLALFPIIRTEFQLSLLQLGVIAAIPSLIRIILTIPTGLFVDRFGAKKIIILSFSSAVLSTLLASQTTTIGLLILSITLVYTTTSIYHPAAYSFITQLFTPLDRAKVIGVHDAGGEIGSA